MGRFGVVFLLAVAASASACGKQEISTSLTWYTELAPALAKARAEHKPLFVYAGAEWDAASKELERVTFPAGDVNITLRRNFVLLKIDCTDDEALDTKQLSERFKIVGTPAMIVYGSSGMTELTRFTSFIPPEKLGPALRRALRPAAEEEAIEAARLEQLRETADEARWRAQGAPR